jgi:RNA polymerase sigma-70 factor, ECF subfamily
MSAELPGKEPHCATPFPAESLDAARFGDWLAGERESVLRILEQRVSEALLSKVELDDLLQDAATRALAILAKQSVVAANPLSWFLTILDHQIIDAHRYHFAAQKRDARREISGQAHGVNADGSDAAPGFIECWPQVSRARVERFRAM